MLHIQSMSNESFITYLNRRISTGKTISREELKKYYDEWGEKPVSDSSFRVMISRLKNKGELVSVKRGLYKLGGARRFTVPADEYERNIFFDLKENFPFAEILTWNTAFFDHFSSLQSVKNRTIVEVNSGSEEAVFAHLQNEYNNRIFLKPDEETYLNYVSQLNHPIIVKPVISESPVEETEGVIVPSVEKIIVDLFADEYDFLPWLSERPRIIRELFDNTTVNLSTLMRYAARRNRKSFFKKWLIDNQVVKAELLEDL